MNNYSLHCQNLCCFSVLPSCVSSFNSSVFYCDWPREITQHLFCWSICGLCCCCLLTKHCQTYIWNIWLSAKSFASPLICYGCVWSRVFVLRLCKLNGPHSFYSTWPIDGFRVVVVAWLLVYLLKNNHSIFICVVAIKKASRLALPEVRYRWWGQIPLHNWLSTPSSPVISLLGRSIFSCGILPDLLCLGCIIRWASSEHDSPVFVNWKIGCCCCLLISVGSDASFDFQEGSEERKSVL